ncbi:flagellar export chaperone FliS [Leifsonia sp. Leaf264]|uniref:flagellar export chaperone FliS n=1 Tax=Leifsonia sp. Leaf264 TaxID=1736314 RepID=UPI0006F8204E|nr:flagellar export chaperone FliS [Leifsonia sp. Leaf264]KQO98227.1 hypothetical protein ASF30_09200 [Leifsonia sp. Leaf264]
MNAALKAYKRSANQSATPRQIVLMAYDRLMLDLERAKAAQEEQNWAEAHNQLVHAQALVTELQIALDVDAWDGGERLYAIYEYVSQSLVKANINRNITLTEECLVLIGEIHEAWKAAAASLPAEHMSGAFNA